MAYIAGNGRPLSGDWLTHRDIIRLAEDAIRQHLAKEGLERKQRVSRVQSHPVLCFLAIYVAIFLVVTGGYFLLQRMQCDPMFTDRGLKSVCRYSRLDYQRIVGANTPSDLDFMNAGF